MLLVLLAGCVVPQPRGEGKLTREVEPTTKRGYWRYLPKDYVKADDAGRRARRWPLVVTFHGMKPFDNALPQAEEWEAEADRYGYIVIAPELRAPDVLAEFPVTNVHPAFKSDEIATLAILDHMFATTAADPTNVLSTSWSSGGYMAHYMMNRHPERFTCLAVRQSNFSSSILDPEMCSRSQNHPILIINTENDFAICVDESRKARAWYSSRGYANLAWVVIRSLGHERTPDLAADFFGHVSGAQPRGSTTVLAQRQAIEGNETGIAFLSGKMSASRSATVASVSPSSTPPRSSPSAPSATVIPPPTPTPQPTPPRPAPPRPDVAQRPAPASPPITAVSSGGGDPEVQVRGLPRVADARPTAPPPSPPAASPPLTPERASAIPARNVPRRDPTNIRVGSAIGLEPLHLSYSAEVPVDWYDTASFLWTLNGETLGTAVNGQKTIATPGEHLLELLVVTREGTEHRASRTIRVIPRLSAANSGGPGPGRTN